MRYVSLAILSAAAITLAASAASAQFYPRYPAFYAGPRYEPAYSPYTYGAYVAPEPGFYCVKDCAQDMSPCDPPEFKRTDARCSSPAVGAVR